MLRINALDGEGLGFDIKIMAKKSFSLLDVSPNLGVRTVRISIEIRW